MTDDLSTLWWMFTMKGLLSIAFACICYLLSSASASLVLRPLGYLYLLVFFSFYVCMSGIIFLVGSIYSFDFKLGHRRLLLLHAIVDLVIGPIFLATFGFGFSFSFIVVLFGLHAAVLGVCYVMLALNSIKQKRTSYVLGLAGILSLLAGACLTVFRSLSPGRLTLAASFYSAIFGILLLLISVDLRTAHRKLSEGILPV